MDVKVANLVRNLFIDVCMKMILTKEGNDEKEVIIIFRSVQQQRDRVLRDYITTDQIELFCSYFHETSE